MEKKKSLFPRMNLAQDDDSVLRLAAELFFGRCDASLKRQILEDVPHARFMPFYFLQRFHEQKGDVWPRRLPAPSPDHVRLAYQLILNRSPESEEAVDWHSSSCATVADLVSNFMLGEEFRSKAVQIVTRLFHTSPKVWHIHIPKTAGTTFFESFHSRGWAVAHDSSLKDPSFAFKEMSENFSLSRLRTGIIVTGHRPLHDYAPLIGPFDWCIAFVRDPLERAVSYFNYMCTIVASDPERLRPDTQHFLASGLDVSSFEKTYANSAILAPNEQCQYLSESGTCASVLTAVRKPDCLLFDASQVSAVIGSLLKMPDNRRSNVSTSFVQASDLRASFRERILADNSEDVALLRIVRERPPPFATLERKHSAFFAR